MNEIWGNFVNLIKSIYFSIKNNKRDRILIIIISSILFILIYLCSTSRSTSNNDEPIMPDHTEIAATIYAEIYLHTEIAATIYAELALLETSTPVPTNTLIPTNTLFPTSTVMPTNTPTIAPTMVLIPTAFNAASSNCDPSYPDVCIPSPPPDLNCDDIPYRRFRVLPPDPHGFDRDKDGIGCES
jgi:hypothetical protein